MSDCQIKSFIVHKLIKDQHGQATIATGAQLLQTNPAIQNLVDEIHKKYKTQSKSFGKFEENITEYPFQQYIDSHLLQSRTPDFLAFSCDALTHLRVTTTDVSFATGGWVVICEYEANNNHYIVIAIVNESHGATVNETTYQVSNSIYVDLNKLRHAGRINIDQWQSGIHDKYVSFLRKGKETTYFQKYLGCNNIQERKAESDKLVKAVKQFTRSLPSEEKDRIYKLSNDFLNRLANENLELDLESFAKHVCPESSESLHEFLCSDELELSNGFVPDKTSIRSFLKFVAKDKDWQLSFSRDALNDFSYDDSSRILTIEVKNDNAHQILCEELISNQDQTS